MRCGNSRRSGRGAGATGARRLGNAAAAAALVVIAACGARGQREAAMKLTGEGYIKVAGGCVAYRQGALTFKPLGRGVRLTVDNAGGWFWRENEPAESFAVDLPAATAAAFFAELKETLAHPRRPKHAPSTRMAFVEIYLPLAGGAMAATWREADGEVDVEPLLLCINNFVRACAERRKE